MLTRGHNLKTESGRFLRSETKLLTADVPTPPPTPPTPIPANQWYVSPSGVSTNTGSLANPWNLAYAGAGASGLIVPGDTVWVRGGTYASTIGFTFSVSGTAQYPINFKAYNNEQVILDGSFPAFSDPTLRQTAWEVVGLSSAGHNVYRSTAVYPDLVFYAGFIQIGSDWYSLATHKSGVDYITSDIHTWRFVNLQPGSGLEQPFYMGPGMCHNPVNAAGTTHGDGRLYVRLDNSSAQAQSNPLYAVPYMVTAAPNTGIVIYDTGTTYATARFPTRIKNANTTALVNPFTMGTTGTMTIYLNPGTYDISIGGGPISSFTLNPDPSEPTPRAVTQIIDPDPRNNVLYIGQANFYGLTVKGSHLYFQDFADINNFYGCYGFIGAAGQTDITLKNCGGRTLYFGARCGTATHLKFDSCKIYGKMNSDKWWVAWGDVKGGNTPANDVRKNAFDLGGASYIEIVDCLIEEFFDGILSSAAHNVEVHGTTFNHIWDDAWQMYYSLYQINYHHNYHYGAGPSVDSSGTGSANPDPGTVWIHHNVVDTTTRQLYWQRWGRSEVGLLESVALSTHYQLKQYTWPRKFYYNTIVTGALPGNAYLSWELHDATAPNSQTQHEVYNNVLNVIDGRPCGRDFYANSGREIYDGNVYWHWQNGSSSGYKSPWRIMHTSTGLIQNESLQTVTQLRASQAFIDSQVYYSPGWEASGLSVDPQLDVNYKPQTASCQSGAVNLTAKGWPGTSSYEPWRGAINPI